ncbi:MAG: AraC family transcriptional regulator [Erysipelotrichia bacterium]|nr:AraC family transcriptional regulator [Erysipelotrichia bacterium]NCC55631.1 AraC family transcriptional regulator [Erysipelotrichia bacterium]
MSNQRYQVKDYKLEKMNVQLLYITQAKYDTDWHSIKHTHHFTELFYVMRGKGSFLVEDEKFDVKEDDLIVVNPNVAHAEVSVPDTPLEYIVLGISGLQFLSEENNELYDYSVHNYYEYKHEILFYLRTLVEEIKNEDENYEAITQNLLEILILNILRRTKKKIQIKATKKVTKECRFIEQYINDHFAEDITLQKLSELTYLNKYYIVHVFKKYKGLSPINYLIERRMEEAKNLLETTNYSVSKISDIIGFSSQSYFSQTFKKEMDMTPNQFRKRMEKARK